MIGSTVNGMAMTKLSSEDVEYIQMKLGLPSTATLEVINLKLIETLDIEPDDNGDFHFHFDFDVSQSAQTIFSDILDKIIVTKRFFGLSFTTDVTNFIKSYKRETYHGRGLSHKTLMNKIGRKIHNIHQLERVRCFYNYPRFTGEQRENLLYSLDIIQKTSDYELLKVQVQLIVESSHQCEARHFDTLMQIYRAAWNSRNILLTSCFPHDGYSGLKGKIQDYLDERKSKAFKTAFVIPTEIVYRSIHDDIRVNDVNIHGSNVYLSLIEQALQIHGPKPAYEEDEIKAVFEFLNRELLHPVLYDFIQDYLTDEKNLGKDVDKGVIPYTHRAIRSMHAFDQFLASGGTAGEKSRNIVKYRPRAAIPYLENYLKFFWEESLLTESFWNFLYQSEFKGSLGQIYCDLKSNGVINTLDEYSDNSVNIASWIYNHEEYRFNRSKFKIILQHLGVCK